MAHFNPKRTGRLSTALRSASITLQWENSWLPFLLAQITQWWHLLWRRQQWEYPLLGQRTLIYWHHEAAMPHGTASHASLCPASHDLSHLCHARISVEAMSVVMHCSASLLRETVVRPDSWSKAFKMVSTNKGPSRQGRGNYVCHVLAHGSELWKERDVSSAWPLTNKVFYWWRIIYNDSCLPKPGVYIFPCGAGNMHYMKWIYKVYGIFISFWLQLEHPYKQSFIPDIQYV